jgi:hypothetical protein
MSETLNKTEIAYWMCVSWSYELVYIIFNSEMISWAIQLADVKLNACLLL